MAQLSDGKAWVKVTGKITFAEKANGQGYITVVQLNSPLKSNLEIIPPDPKQYVY